MAGLVLRFLSLWPHSHQLAKEISDRNYVQGKNDRTKGAKKGREEKKERREIKEKRKEGNKERTRERKRERKREKS